jgi:hypothetical protein
MKPELNELTAEQREERLRQVKEITFICALPGSIKVPTPGALRNQARRDGDTALKKSWQSDTARELAADEELGSGLAPEIAAQVERLELIASSVNDPRDWCEWRAFDGQGKLIATVDFYLKFRKRARKAKGVRNAIPNDRS